MSKYSIQNECLEMIGAFSDEQLNSEMIVIESVLDIFDKSILMMELTNADIDLPECPMFMESFLIQEAPDATGGEQNQTTENNTQDANTSESTDNGDAKKSANTISEEERKKYNSEHQFRQKNKKGKVENWFFSIILFIPRFLGFLIQCVVKLFKKIFNKDADKKVKDASKKTTNLTADQKAKLAEDAKTEEGENNTNTDANANNGEQNTNGQNNSKAGEFDVNTLMFKWWDHRQLIQEIERLRLLFESFNLNDAESVKKFVTGTDGQVNISVDIGKIQVVAIQGDLLVDAKNEELNALKALSDLAGKKKEEVEKVKEDRSLWTNFVGKFKGESAALKAARGVCDKLKQVCTEVSDMTKNMFEAYVRTVKWANDITGVFGDNPVLNDQSNQNDQGTNANNNGGNNAGSANNGGENNGGSETIPAAG